MPVNCNTTHYRASSASRSSPAVERAEGGGGYSRVQQVESLSNPVAAEPSGCVGWWLVVDVCKL